MSEILGHITKEEMDRYLNNKMTDKERNAFERKLEQNPFAREAMEGLELVSASEVNEDVQYLEGKIKESRRKEKSFNWYRIAAAVTLIIGLTTVFYFINENKPNPQTSENEIKDNTIEHSLSSPEPVHDSLIAGKKELASNSEQSDKNVKKALRQADKKKITLMTKRENESKLEEEITPLISDDRQASTEIIPEQDLKPNSPKSMAGGAGYSTESRSKITGLIFSADDGMPVPGASVIIKGTNKGTMTDNDGKFELFVPDSNVTLLADFIGMQRAEIKVNARAPVKIALKPNIVAMNEVVVVGESSKSGLDATSAVSKVEINASSPAVVYHQAEPETGYPAFYNYVKTHIRFPVNDTLTRRSVVVLELNVSSNGTIQNIKVIKSPGQSYTDIAMNIIQDGPAWKPSRQGDRAIEDHIRIRILFKR